MRRSSRPGLRLLLSAAVLLGGPIAAAAQVSPPEDPEHGSLRFYTLSEGLRSPVEFRAREDGGLDLVLDRYVFHKQD